MKRAGKIAVGLAVGLALNAGLRAAELAMANNLSPANPYAMIAVRNIFGLNPPPPAEPPASPEKDLPKITPTGIQTYFGQSQVLFKVAPAKPGPTAKVEYYTLSQGQRQDDIEVVNIDETKGVVTFDNHGFTQELPLAEAPASGGAAAPASTGGAMNTAAARGGFGGGAGGGGGSGAGGFTRFGAAPGANNGGTPNSNPGFNNGGNPNSANGGMNFGNSTTQGRGYQPEASTMTPEQSVIWIEAQRAQAQQDNNPIQKILPPTPLTEFNTPGGNPPMP